MGRERTKSRTAGKIDGLPPNVKEQVDIMLLDTAITYTEISQWLINNGYEISRSSVGRYALRTNNLTQRMLEAQQRTEALVKVVQQNPDADYSEAGMRLLMDGLVNRLAMAQEEFDELPVEKAGKLITALSRTKAYKDKVKQDMQKKIELAFQGMEAEIMSVLKADKELSEDLKNILERAKSKMLEEEKQ